MDFATAIKEHVYIWCCTEEHQHMAAAQLREAQKQIEAEAQKGAEAGAA